MPVVPGCIQATVLVWGTPVLISSLEEWSPRPTSWEGSSRTVFLRPCHKGLGVTHASQEKPCGFACKAGGSLRLPAPHTSPKSSRLLAEPAASWAALLFPVDPWKRLQTVPTLYCEVLGVFRSHRGPHQSKSTCPGLGWGGGSGKNPRWPQS